MIVIDASVAAKWFLPEVGSDEAVKLQEGPSELIGPELIRMEVAGAITRRVRDKGRPLPPAEALRHYAVWFRLLEQATIGLIPESEILNDAIKLSVEVRHPLHDCIYLAASAATEGSAHYRRSCISRPREAVLRQDFHPAGL